jgi:hypothetical protein
VYYLNLPSHHIVGIASLTNGGGLFSGLNVWTGLVLDGEASDLTSNGKSSSDVVLFNEVDQRQTTLTWPSNSVPFFQNFELLGQQLDNAKLSPIAHVPVPENILLSPASRLFP